MTEMRNGGALRLARPPAHARRAARPLRRRSLPTEAGLQQLSDPRGQRLRLAVIAHALAGRMRPRKPYVRDAELLKLPARVLPALAYLGHQRGQRDEALLGDCRQ